MMGKKGVEARTRKYSKKEWGKKMYKSLTKKYGADYWQKIRRGEKPSKCG